LLMCVWTGADALDSRNAFGSETSDDGETWLQHQGTSHVHWPAPDKEWMLAAMALVCRLSY